jgi:hypothetical protein
MIAINKKLNPTRMTPQTREKLRNIHLGTGGGETAYTKIFSRAAHRVIAEQALGRELVEGEVVHHIDGNSRNNHPENLRVFATNSEHARFHHELRAVLSMLDG